MPAHRNVALPLALFVGNLLLSTVPACGSEGAVAPAVTNPDAAVSPGEDAAEADGGTCNPGPDAVGTAPAELDEAIEAALETHKVAGCAVAIVKNGKMVFAKGYGIANPAGEPESARRIHVLASASKPITAVAVMQLVEAGKLRLDDDVNTHLSSLPLVVRNPAYPNVPITIRMLLTHTASIGDSLSSFDPTWYSKGDSPIGLRDFVAGYFTPSSEYSGGADTFLDQEPGKASCYSNMGVALLSLVVEVVSGETFADFCRTKIFAKLGMRDTSFLLRDQCDPARLSTGMRDESGTFVPDDNGNFGQPEGHPELASGMLRSTASDMARFATALANGGELDGARILSTESVAEIVKRQLSASVTACNERVIPADQGLLGYFTKDGLGEYFGHAGGMNGIGTEVYFRTSDKAAFVVLGNATYDAWIGDVEAALQLAEPDL
jgi:CubicO group peptidase (beta-lactamase class C family)